MQLRRTGFIIVLVLAIQGCQLTGDPKSSTEGCSGDIRFGASDVTCGDSVGSLKFEEMTTGKTDTYTFPTIMGSSLVTADFELTNTGSSTISNISVTDLNTPFKLGGGFPGVNGTCTTSLEPGAKCRLGISVDPDKMTYYATDVAKSEFKIKYNDGNSAQSLAYTVKTDSPCSDPQTKSFGTTTNNAWGLNSSTEWMAQSFKLNKTNGVKSITTRLYATAAGGSVESTTLSIRADCSGRPCDTDSLSDPVTVSTTSVNNTGLTSFTWSFTKPIELYANRRYWLVIRFTNLVNGGGWITVDGSNTTTYSELLIYNSNSGNINNWYGSSGFNGVNLVMSMKTCISD